LNKNRTVLKKKSTYIIFLLLFIVAQESSAQDEVIQGIGNRIRTVGGAGRTGSTGTDSLRRRDKNADSITISYKYLDSTGNYKLDSSVSDFTKRFPIPATHIFLGNTGNAAKSLLFSPQFSSGFNTGLNAFDIYTLKPEAVRFYNTTRPYSELNYQLASRAEQIIDLVHTQNLKPDWNVAFRYRLINAPGFFKNQKTNHNNYLLNSLYASKNRRYKNYFILLGNKLQSSENGGIVDTVDYLNNPNRVYNDRFNIPVKLGGDEGFSSNFFTTKISTGNKYSLFTVLMRQQYDLGKKDSIVTDSTVIPLFFPRLRFEHTFTLEQNKYIYQDYVADSVYYKTYYDTTLSKPIDTFLVRERWNIVTNDFSIYQFPDAKNQHQFFKVGLLIQNLHGEFTSGSKNFFNTAGHAEYRNKTKNQQWDIEAFGKLYFTGLNSGDFEAHISLQKLLGKKVGSLKLGFENANRTPSFVFDSRSSFYLLPTAVSFKKENNTHLYANYSLPTFKLNLSGHYYLLTNYTYLSNYYELKQDDGLFNLLQIGLNKIVKLGKKWYWHFDMYLQKRIGDGSVQVPLIFNRNRIGYEGNLGFKNLVIAMGVESRFTSAYKADGYSPILGKYFYQDSVTIKNKLPDISAYVHFRVRSFKAFIRAENLHTVQKKQSQGLSFTNNSIVAPGYAMPGLQIRVGIYWGFVN